MTQNISNKSKQLSFYQLFSKEKYCVEIPIIQRDYAQGRITANEVRKDFLEALYNYLEENKPKRDLDFVYGDVNASVFIPLDGQQRLTTLFLLHWYLALRDNNYADFQKMLTNTEGAKFRYKTRISSTDFCNALIKNNIDLNNLNISKDTQKPSLSETIKDKAWYFSSWANDPTIQSMLCMLDDIHQKFEKTSGFYARLIDNENPVITFQFLSLAEYGLSDDLYIKMNSRGKPLTKFEHFKSKFEDRIGQSKITNTYLLNGKRVSVKAYFSHKIDTDWVKIFWEYREKEKNTYDKKKPRGSM